MVNTPVLATAGHKTLLAELHEEIVNALGASVAESLCIQRAVLGIFFTGVQLDNGVGGLCATPVKSVPAAVCCPSSASAMPIPGKIVGRSAAEVLADLYRPQDLRRALAIATLNALAETLWLRDGLTEGVKEREGDAFDALDVKPNDRVVLVGAFPPYMRELRRRGQQFHVLELDPTALKPEEMPFLVPPERAAEVVSMADVLIATGTTLVNGTIDDLLRSLRSGAQAAIVGPTATLRMGPFVRRGVTILGGTRVRSPGTLLDLLAEGGSGYHLFGKSVERVSLLQQTL